MPGFPSIRAEKCNDFSIGIELEGTDECDFTPLQYQQLSTLTQQLLNTIRALKENITGHVMSHLVGKQIRDLILIGHITEHY